jgi:threonine/homoserine/homoserine lactone efflux protein
MMGHAAAFLLFAVVAAATPGPSNMILAATGAQVGLLRGLPCLLGVSTGMGLMLFAVLLGLGRLVLAQPAALEALRWAGAAVLLWLSWRIAAAPAGPHGDPASKPVGYLGAAAFQWVNPKSWLVSASAAGTFFTTGRAGATTHAAYLAALFVLAALPSGFVWLAFGSGVQRALRTPRRMRAFSVAMGLLLAGSVFIVMR